MKGIKLSIFAVAILIISSVLGYFGAEKAEAAPLFQVPFPCGQKWAGQTRTNHSPANSVDLNRANDENDVVVASAPGTVDRVENLGNRSYGKFIVINHGGGWKTYYAHLNHFSVKRGQKVTFGQAIGKVGNTGGSYGAHLHYEQRYNGNVMKIRWNGAQIHYWGERTYTSKNKCSNGSATGTVKLPKNMKALNAHQKASTKSKVTASFKNGAKVKISCQTTGDTVKGTYGTSKIWNKVGKDRYVPDAYIFTGSDGRVAPPCKK
ncbi:peptidase m23 [Fictibacillus macauensis ZFHKF-1]|uniref:Peptidase m23 n=1 Tax=Fictibacillus macauensis ZFHKF-1 TaxID=1196324 RepID=I8IWJ7_9BACL|nr:M23 family metallopeptidase [Fictibacillus macauensis]EIT83876.1 peptidase m23 [Fictibacillus macauensis ZFHKF-1]